MPDDVQLTVNGEARTVAAGTTVADLLQRLGILREFAAVERNRAIVRRADHAAAVLQDGDCVEVVEFVGGG
jgi:thiamine biosynthesis protein ThiS